MNDVLSADAIAEMFAAAKEGKAPEDAAPRPRRSRSIRTIDFARPMKLSLLEQRRFEQAHANFCSEVSARLTGEMRSPIEIEVINSAQLTWDTALANVPQPSILGVAACAPSEAKILICMETSLLLRMTECLLGGSYTAKPTPREMTQIDSALARRIFELLLGSLSNTWDALLGLTVSLLEFEVYSTVFELQQASQPTLELTIEVRDQSVASTILLLVPYPAIETAGKSLGASKYRDGSSTIDEESGEAVRTALGGVRIEVRAEVGDVGLTIGEVLSLGEGDVVRLGEAGNAVITVGEGPLHRARPGLSGRHRAVQIIEPVGDRA